MIIVPNFGNSSDDVISFNCYNNIKRKYKPCMRGPRGGGGPDPPTPTLNKYKNIGFLSNTDPDPMNNHKDTKPAFNIEPSSARQRNAI